MSNALAVQLPDGEPFMDYEREFDFPVHDVFRAHMDPDVFAQWIGPRRLSTRIDLFEPQTGGGFRFVQSGNDGAEHAFRGVFHCVREDDFVVQTFEYEGYPDTVSLEYSTFTQLPGGRCKLSGRSLYPSVESRDQMASSGMEGGMSAGYDQLDEILDQGRPAT
ncbi:uncharacterized protein YndB with AHSA1/START domain [Arthrobacter sp. UYP6]|uniref:SRPBCC family protein n=1 Tax=Arthrobacter sp. UYP6 TaxID=1756378 RepID=UPI0033962128